MPGSRGERRRGVRRAFLWLAVVLAAVGALSSVSWTRETTLQLVGDGQRLITGGYVRYHFAGSLINPVHPVTYDADPGAIERADAQGRVTIPFRLHRRSPFPLSTPPAVVVDCVYVPRLHSAFGPIGRFTQSHAGVFAIDESLSRITVFDASRDPQRWEGSLRTLFQCIRDTLDPGAGRSAPAGAATRLLARELVAHLRAEYRAFLDTYGATRRERPLAPAWASEQERLQWESTTDAHLAREPLWGPYLERMWRGNLEVLDRLERAAP